MQIFLIYLISYILGSIPFGFIIAYLIKRIDIRNFGSGNIGATNVTRVIGKFWGVVVFILDFLKAFIPIIFAKSFLKIPSKNIYIFMALFSVVGHNWPIFLKFKGGKGVATSLGAMIALSFIFTKLWLVIFIGIISWLVVFFIWRYVSLASIFAGFIFFISALVFINDKEIKILSFFLLILIIVRHKKNIKNLITKEEYRF
ncbi:MAG: glycerol-3-phosphate 1-O-acyltransferase PlsY [Candidatus Omnitrophica bacterium]|nr:glycerol-3-phosphate 1-O-acyltransferase PlsY [Candidatus Omnitrophota bacterium]MCM8831358.1 glycerol-3-phosphate 1-O-acyltransferase PlsY [Candidatus Omnitrophota bacterium]